MIYRAYRDYTHAARRSVTDLYLYHLYTYMHAPDTYVHYLDKMPFISHGNDFFVGRDWFLVLEKTDLK